MITYESNKVIRASAAAPQLNPKTAITIAVDTAYIAANQGQNISTGIYMMDNMSASGSTGEGTLELSTVCAVGSLIGFNVVPIDAERQFGDSLVISGFTVSQGSVFTAAGQPVQETSPTGGPAGSYWVGQALNAGNQTYQIQIAVTVGVLHPVTYYINWDPFITAR